MSDAAQVVDTAGAATAAPAPETVAAPQPVTQPGAPSHEAKSGRDRGRAAMRDALQKFDTRPVETPAAPAPSVPSPAETQPVVIDANGREHGPDGKFVPEPQAVATPPVETAEPAATAPQTVRINVPEGELRRAVGGLEHIDVPPELEQFARWTFNNYTRRAEAEQSRAAAEQWQDRALELEAHLRAVTETRQALVSDNEVLAVYNELKAANPAVAETYLKGWLADQEGKAGSYIEEARAQQQEARHQRTVASFLSGVLETASTRYPAGWIYTPQGQQAFENARIEYGAMVERREAMGQPVQLTEQDFTRILDRIAIEHEPVRQFAQQRLTAREQAGQQRIQQDADARARQAAAEQEAVRLRAAGERHATRPATSQIPSAVQSGARTPVPEENLRNQPPDKQRKALRGWVSSLVR